MREQGTSSADHRLFAGLFLVLSSLYALTGPGHSSSNDGLLIVLSARSFLAGESTAVPPVATTEGITRVRGVDGREYPIFGPGLLIAQIPTLFAAAHLERLRPQIDGHPVKSRARDEFFAPFTNAWLMAAAVVGIAACGSALGFARGPSMGLAALMAIGSPLWVYARSDSTEALQAASLVGATFFLLRDRAEWSPCGTLLAGSLAGIAVAAKVLNLVLVPWLVMLALWQPIPARVRRLWLFAVPVVIALALIAAFNFARFGSPFDTGYDVGGRRFGHPFLDGAYVQLLSPGFGLLVFWPAFVLVPFVVPRFFERFPRETLVTAGMLASYVALYSKWWAYWGMGWGPRFLVPLIPLLALILLPFAAASGWRRGALIVFLCAGIAVQTIAVGTSFWGQVIPAWQRLEGSPDIMRDPRVSPLRIGFWWLRNAGCRRADEVRSLSPPPWLSEFPWRDAERAPVELRFLSGLDLWAVPDCWKPRIPLSGEAEEVLTIPGDPPLRWVLLVIAAIGAGMMVSGRARRRSVS